jgi:hypothetical protein
MRNALHLLLTLTALGLVTNALADDKTFFSGAHLGMTIEECVAYYHGGTSHSGAPPGERLIDFRTNSEPTRRVLVYCRTSDRKIVSVIYWKMGVNETFTPEEIRYLTDLNRGQGSLVTHLYGDNNADGAEFEVTTHAQDKLERIN